MNAILISLFLSSLVNANSDGVYKYESEDRKDIAELNAESDVGSIFVDHDKVLWSARLPILALDTKDAGATSPTEPVRVSFQSVFKPNNGAKKLPPKNGAVTKRRTKRKKKSKIFPSVSLFGSGDNKKRKPESEVEPPPKRQKVDQSIEILSSAELLLKKEKDETDAEDDLPRKVQTGRRKNPIKKVRFAELPPEITVRTTLRGGRRRRRPLTGRFI